MPKFSKNILIADLELKLYQAKLKVQVLNMDAVKAYRRYEKAETFWNDKEVALENMKKLVRSLNAKLSHAKKKDSRN